MTTLYDRINTLLRLDIARNNISVPQDKYRDASGAIADNALGIINELCERLEKANQLFQDLCDMGGDPCEDDAIHKGIEVTDIVADYKVDHEKMKLEA